MKTEDILLGAAILGAAFIGYKMISNSGGAQNQFPGGYPPYGNAPAPSPVATLPRETNGWDLGLGIVNTLGQVVKSVVPGVTGYSGAYGQNFSPSNEAISIG